MTHFYYFLTGAAMFGAAMGGLYFLKFWFVTRDRLFLWFNIAFWIMAIERLVLAIFENPESEVRSLIYLIRLAAFLLILFAIVDKNRQEKLKTSS